jgi:hypothetical protein
VRQPVHGSITVTGGTSPAGALIALPLSTGCPPGVATEAPRRVPPPTIDEFLEMEEASPTKHMYVAGQLYALSEATARQSTAGCIRPSRADLARRALTSVDRDRRRPIMDVAGL